MVIYVRYGTLNREVTRRKLKSGTWSEIKAYLWVYKPHQRETEAQCCATLLLFGDFPAEVAAHAKS